MHRGEKQERNYEKDRFEKFCDRRVVGCAGVDGLGSCIPELGPAWKISGERWGYARLCRRYDHGPDLGECDPQWVQHRSGVWETEDWSAGFAGMKEQNEKGKMMP